jgi:hypothetical protein
MPERVKYSKRHNNQQVVLSIYKFSVPQEEIFLLHTWEFENGPEIVRDGLGPPTMELRGGPHAEPGARTANPYGQRLRTALIQEDLRKEEEDSLREALKNAQDALADARKRGVRKEIEILEEEVELLEWTLSNDLPRVSAHDTEFLKVYPDYCIVGQQGCGDLSMNLWNVAYFNSPLAPKQPFLVYLRAEPISRRTYSCLIKWLPGKGPNKCPHYEVTIQDARFAPFATNKNDFIFVWDEQQKDWIPHGEDVEFAVSNQQVIRQGEIVNISRIIHEFSDLRHLFQLPNLNPGDNRDPRNNRDPKYLLFSGDSGRPRFYFGRSQMYDIWFGEAQLLEDPNLQRAAIAGPIFVSRLYRGLGASREQIEGAMRLANYELIDDPRQPLTQGQYRFLPEDDNVLEIYLKRNTYAWSMIGVDREGKEILALACEGRPGPGGRGYILEDAVKEMLGAGAYNALLIDEGADVFQKIALNGSCTSPMRTVPEKEFLRRRLRASFIFAQKKTKEVTTVLA